MRETSSREHDEQRALIQEGGAWKALKRGLPGCLLRVPSFQGHFSPFRIVSNAPIALHVQISLAAMTVHPMGDAHPYFPLDLHLPDYVPMQVDFDYILGVFFTAVLVVFAATWWLSGGCGASGWTAGSGAANRMRFCTAAASEAACRP